MFILFKVHRRKGEGLALKTTKGAFNDVLFTISENGIAKRELRACGIRDINAPAKSLLISIKSSLVTGDMDANLFDAVNASGVVPITSNRFLMHNGFKVDKEQSFNLTPFKNLLDSEVTRE